MNIKKTENSTSERDPKERTFNICVILLLNDKEFLLCVLYTHESRQERNQLLFQQKIYI